MIQKNPITFSQASKAPVKASPTSISNSGTPLHFRKAEKFLKRSESGDIVSRSIVGSSQGLQNTMKEKKDKYNAEVNIRSNRNSRDFSKLFKRQGIIFGGFNGSGLVEPNCIASPKPGSPTQSSFKKQPAFASMKSAFSVNNEIA